MTDQQTRQRILMAAADLFVEKGFQKTTVREICRTARANVAAVNYHFQGKEGLYEAVIAFAIEQKPEIEVQPDDPTEVRLKAWVTRLVFSCIGNEPDLLSQIMANEMVEPTGFLNLIVEQMVMPKMALLQEIVIGGVGPDVPARKIELLTMSIVGQALIYDHCRPVVDMLMPAMSYSDDDLEELVDHITKASMGMIDAFRESK